MGSALAALGGLAGGIAQGRAMKSEMDTRKAKKNPSAPTDTGTPPPVGDVDYSRVGGQVVQPPPDWLKTGIPDIVPTPKPIAHKGGRIVKTGTYRMKAGEIVIPAPSKKRSTRKTGRKGGRKSGR